MDLSIVTVSWNVKDKLRESLKAIFSGCAGLSLEVFVVDNASADGTVEMVRKEFPQVHMIANENNRGFAVANNQAIRESSGDFVLLLNPDMRVFPETLGTMVRWMHEHLAAGIAGCQLVDERGNTVPHVRRFPAFLDQAAILLKLPHLFPGVINRYLMSDFDYSRDAEVDSIRGSFFMIRREVLFDGLARPYGAPPAVGLLDERFFLWFEEVDLCKRVHDVGWKIMYTPAAKCVDYVGQSFKQMTRYKKQKMFTESMIKYFWKHASWWKAMLITILRPIGLAAAWVAERAGK